MSKVWRRWSQTDSEAILKRKRSRKLRLCEAMVCGSKTSTSDNHLLEETTRCGGNPFWKGRDVVRPSYSLVNTTDSGVAKGVHDGKPISRHSFGFAQIKNYINILLPLEKSFYLIISTSVVPFRNQVKRLGHGHAVWSPCGLRCFDTVFRRPYWRFSIALKVFKSLSDRYKIFTSD